MPQELLLLGALSGGMIVLSGGLYALLFALARLRNSRELGYCAYAAYAILVVFSLSLLHALRLEGAWTVLVIVMLAGYLLAPKAVWHLCVGTHGEHGRNQSRSGTEGIGG